MAISTARATITTKAEMINPWSIGRIPAFFMLAKEVFKPIAANAHTIRNLLRVLVADTISAGTETTLATSAIARKPRINHGKIFAMLKSAFNSEPDT